MGEVNTVAVEAAGPDAVRIAGGGPEFVVRDVPADFAGGFLIIRPEVVKLGRAASDVANTLTGTLFNDYALGSRIQYQIRTADDAHWLVERLQDEPFEGALGDEVTVGWRPEDSILVSR